METKSDLLTVIGGELVLQAVVEEFYQRVLGDPALMPFFRGVPMRRLIGHQTAFLGKVLRGQKHNPEAMRRAHFGRGIEARHFDRVAQHLVETLRGLGVGEVLVSEIVARVSPLRDEVVEHGSEPDVLANTLVSSP